MLDDVFFFFIKNLSLKFWNKNPQNVLRAKIKKNLAFKWACDGKKSNLSRFSFLGKESSWWWIKLPDAALQNNGYTIIYMLSKETL
jgi:hypothetical protein